MISAELEKKLDALVNKWIAAEPFWRHVNKTETCWLWTGSLSLTGYGRYCVSPKQRRSAHRWLYEAMVGPVPPGLELDHLCRVRRCVYPVHLEAVTHRENTLRGKTIPAAHAVKTHCPQGHEYSATNTIRDAKGRRYCRACRNPRQMVAYYERRRVSRAIYYGTSESPVRNELAEAKALYFGEPA